MPVALPEKFRTYRPNQEDAVDHILTCDRRFPVLCAPTGFGKSVCLVAAAVQSKKRTCILTTSKGLQTQLLRDFTSCGIVDIRGRANYRCAMRPGYTCLDGGQAGCPYRESQVCPYRRAQATASSAWIVVSNYAAWQAAYATNQGWGQFDLLICDEAADLFEHISGSLRIEVGDEESGALGPPTPRGRRAESLAAWAEWATAALPEARAQLKDLARRIEEPNPKLSWIREHHHLQNLVARLQRLRAARPQDWIVDESRDGYVFDPLRPAAYAEDWIFMGVPKVVLVSATIREKTMGLLGIPRSSYSFREYPSSFDPSRCPIYHIPTMRMNRDTEAEGIGEWLTRADQIIGRRRDRNGIFHTVSFRRAQAFLESTAYRNILYWNERGELTAPVIEAYLAAAPPAVLVSPSVHTGYDFPGVAAEYQIIGKIPFPVPTKIQKARESLDPEIGAYQAMQAFVQTCGRPMRSEEDRAENFVIDDSVLWFRKRYRHLAPKWFDARFRQVEVIPATPPKL